MDRYLRLALKWERGQRQGADVCQRGGLGLAESVPGAGFLPLYHQLPTLPRRPPYPAFLFLKIPVSKVELRPLELPAIP